MAHKIKDVAVKTGSYVDKNGIEKGRYENVGVLMQGNDGNHFIILKRTFNPAGVPVQAGKDTIILSLFEPKDSIQAQPEAGLGQYSQSQSFQQPAPAQPEIKGDYIPF